MLKLEPTPYNAGVTLWGDFNDLNALHETIHALVDASPLREGLENVLLSLAYDIRKANEMQGETKTFGFDEFDQVMYRGRPVLWPVLLFQARLLRNVASAVPTNKMQQSQLYLLEGCIEETLREASPAIAQECIDWLNTPLMVTDDYYEDHVTDIARQYVVGPQGKARIKKLPKLLNALHPFSKEYQGFAEYFEGEAAKQGCSPHMLRDNSEWPEFKW